MCPRCVSAAHEIEIDISMFTIIIKVLGYSISIVRTDAF